MAVVSALGFFTNTLSTYSYRTVRKAYGVLINYPEYRAVWELIKEIINREDITPNATDLEIKLDGKRWRIELEDIGSGINPNNLSEDDLRHLLSSCGVPIGAQMDSLIDAFLDWTDKDDMRRLNGAEKEYYLSLPNPYKPRNGPLLSTDEILYIKGFSKVHRCLSKILSIYGTNKVNINTASPEMLKALGLEEEEIESILKKRKEEIITSMEDLREILGGVSEAYYSKWISFVPSGVYKITIEDKGSCLNLIYSKKQKRVLKVF